MNTAPPVFADFLRLFIRHPLRWALPAVVIATAAAAYAVVKPDTWEASLTLVVRAEASGNLDGAGRFRHLTEMKTLQETLLEIAKSRAVLTAALVKAGPSAPTAQDVDDLGDALKLVPPKGSEFGMTEVFYLKVKDTTAARAVALADAVADQMLAQFQKIRDEKARSIITELAKAVDVAREEQRETITALGKYEAGVGGDLAELRSLEQTGSGDGDVRRLTVELESEARQADLALRNLRELLAQLTSAQKDTTKLLATPNRLLESQPALRRLKDGLVDAQLRTSQLLGNMSREHPLVRASLDAENEIRTHLHAELSATVVGVEAEVAVAEKLLTDRQARLAEVHRRLDHLVSLRAEYSALFTENQQRTRQLEQAEKQLSDARAAQAGAAAAGLVSRVDTPDAGSKPQGPGKTTILLVGIVGGLLAGAGLLLLTTTPPSMGVPPGGPIESQTERPVKAGTPTAPDDFEHDVLSDWSRAPVSAV